MPKLLVITGTPGTGKSTLAKILAKKLDFQRLDLHQYYQVLARGYNKKKQCYDIDLTAFKKLVQQQLKTVPKGLIIDSHIAQVLPAKIVDLCIVLVCSDLKKLKKRLEARKYSQNKVRENLDAEIFQVCLTEAQEQGHKIMMIDTAQKISLQTLFRQIGKRL